MYNTIVNYEQDKGNRSKKRSRAEFTYKLGIWHGVNLMLIVDKNNGSLSVTNDMENVVADICIWESIDPRHYFIAYKDTEGDWDGWDAAKGEFFFFRNETTQKSIKDTAKELEF